MYVCICIFPELFLTQNKCVIIKRISPGMLSNLPNRINYQSFVRITLHQSYDRLKLLQATHEIVRSPLLPSGLSYSRAFHVMNYPSLPRPQISDGKFVWRQF